MVGLPIIGRLIFWRVLYHLGILPHWILFVMWGRWCHLISKSISIDVSCSRYRKLFLESCEANFLSCNGVKSVNKGVFDFGIRIWWEQRWGWQKEILVILVSFSEKELVERVKSGVGFRRMQVGMQFVVWREVNSKFMNGSMTGSKSLYWKLSINPSCWRLAIGLIWKRTRL